MRYRGVSVSFKVPEQYRVTIGLLKSSLEDGNNGAFEIPNITRVDRSVFVIASDGAGWEHVSVSKKNSCPSWDVMCRVKDLFWDSDDCVIQYHPPESEYVNNHSNCLHLWRPIGIVLPQPPSILVGIK